MSKKWISDFCELDIQKIGTQWTLLLTLVGVGGGCLYYESDICSAGQDIPRHLLTIPIRYRVPNTLLLNCIMNQKTSSPILSSYMSKTYFKICFPSTTSSVRLELPRIFPEIYSHVPTNAISYHPHRSWFDSLHCQTKSEFWSSYLWFFSPL